MAGSNAAKIVLIINRIMQTGLFAFKQWRCLVVSYIFSIKFFSFLNSPIFCCFWILFLPPDSYFLSFFPFAFSNFFPSAILFFYYSVIFYLTFLMKIVVFLFSLLLSCSFSSISFSIICPFWVFFFTLSSLLAFPYRIIGLCSCIHHAHLPSHHYQDK